MKKLIPYCCHCGKRLDAKRDYGSSENKIAHVKIQADLCKECHEQLVKMVKDFCRCGERPAYSVGNRQQPENAPASVVGYCDRA